jgi:hypothetical protein
MAGVAVMKLLYFLLALSWADSEVVLIRPQIIAQSLY